MTAPVAGRFSDEQLTQIAAVAQEAVDGAAGGELDQRTIALIQDNEADWFDVWSDLYLPTVQEPEHGLAGRS